MTATVAYLDKEDALTMLLHVATEYFTVAKEFGHSLPARHFAIEKNDTDQIKNALKEETDWVKNLKDKFLNISCPDAIAAGLLKKTKHLSEEYAEYKVNFEVRRNSLHVSRLRRRDFFCSQIRSKHKNGYCQFNCKKWIF
jgi:hypothetical protein